MKSILEYKLKELEEELKPSFRAKQIYSWIFKKYLDNFEDMKNLPKGLKEELNANYSFTKMEIKKKEKSKDGCIKYLFELEDGHTIEAVLLLMKKKKEDENGKIIKSEQYTFCLSSQIGCKVGCAFCLTAKGGFVRNLRSSEIIAQVIKIKKDNNIDEDKAVNIVYMGMGEPLDNYDNLIRAIEILSEENGLSISTRRQTISTSGISSKIKKLGQKNLGVQLAISLHAVDDELRSKLIPMNKAYNISTIIQAVKDFPKDMRKGIMFEYLVMKDLNDGLDSAKKLLSLLNGIKAKVNLIYFNPHIGANFKRPTRENMLKFQKYLNDRGLICTIRSSKGLDISAACGQLKEKEKNEYS